jgi:hypothetical protein
MFLASFPCLHALLRSLIDAFIFAFDLSQVGHSNVATGVPTMMGGTGR